MGNYFAKSSVHNNNSLLSIFTVSMLGGVLSGKFALVLGILTAVLFSYGFSQLITEVAYLLYLKTQSKEYWETEPDGKASFRNLFRNLFKEFSLKKAKIRIPLEIFLLLLIIYIDGGNAYINVFINQTRWLLWLIRLFIILIGLDILGSFILYVINKVNTRFKKGKKKWWIFIVSGTLNYVIIDFKNASKDQKILCSRISYLVFFVRASSCNFFFMLDW